MGQPVHVQSSRMGSGSNFRHSLALVQSTVVGLHVGDVQIRNFISGGSDLMADAKSATREWYEEKIPQEIQSFVLQK